MRRPIHASPTDGVAGRALVRSSYRRRRGHPPGAITEQCDRCDVLIHTRRQWVGIFRIPDGPGHEVSHLGHPASSRRALRGGSWQRIEQWRSYRWRHCRSLCSAGVRDPVHSHRRARLAAQRMTSASPTAPTPGGSSRPRAKTTSASGRLCRRCRRNQRRYRKGRRRRRNHQCGTGKRGGGRQAEDTVRAGCSTRQAS